MQILPSRPGGNQEGLEEGLPVLEDRVAVLQKQGDPVHQDSPLLGRWSKF